MKLYHATFGSKRQSIEKNGLLINQNKVWPDCVSGYVYMASDMDGAISICEVAEDLPDEIYNSGICCFEIDTDALDTSLLFVDPNMLFAEDEEPWCFAYKGNIPHSDLKLCCNEQQ